MAISYVFPGAGTVPSTGAQAAYASRQIATVALLTTDTTFTFTHNWGFDTAALARLCPQILINSNGAATALVATRSANAVVFTGTVSVAGTIEVCLDRPHSIIMPNS